jgi:hypothetical protein
MESISLVVIGTVKEGVVVASQCQYIFLVIFRRLNPRKEI